MILEKKMLQKLKLKRNGFYKSGLLNWYFCDVHTLLIDIKLPKYLHVGVGLVSKYCSADDMSRVCTERKL